MHRLADVHENTGKKDKNEMLDARFVLKLCIIRLSSGQILQNLNTIKQVIWDLHKGVAAYSFALCDLV